MRTPLQEMRFCDIILFIGRIGIRGIEKALFWGRCWELAIICKSISCGV